MQPDLRSSHTLGGHNQGIFPNCFPSLLDSMKTNDGYGLQYNINNQNNTGGDRSF